MSITKNKSTATKICCFCNLAEDNELEYGKFYEHNGIVTHYYCLLLSSNMEQKGNDNEGILGFLAADIQKELRRGKRLVCSYCKKIGATLGCCNVRCKRIFHFPCGLKAGSLHQYFGEFRSYCINHRPRQKIDDYILKQIGSLNDILCYICYDEVKCNDSVGTLWAPCCKKDAWFHRKCVQQLALSAGYFFKCPLCNNKKEFQKAMLEYGIFIPSQDASWELVPHAFEELLYRHDRCDAIACLCPKGRKHTSTNAKWELALCRTCGSQGIHMACGQLKWANPLWECSDCTSILCNRRDNTTSSSSSGSSSQTRDSDSDSDTDISVGTDSPVPCLLPSYSSSSTLMEPKIDQLRPGPRSFKLQQMKANRMARYKLQVTHSTSEKTNKIGPNDIVNFTSKDDNFKKESSKVTKDDNIKEESKEKKKDNYRQTSKVNNSVEDRKLANNDEKSGLTLVEADIIVIDSDEDDIEIIPLEQKDVSMIFQTVQTDTLRSNPVNISEYSVVTPHENTVVNKMLIDPLKINSINSQASKVLESKNLNREESVVLEKPNTTMPQNFMQDISSSKKNNLENINLDTNANSVMNIKITNVTSLPPEVFASVPEVGYEENAMCMLSDAEASLSTNKSLEKWFVTHILPPKCGAHEDSNSKRKLGVTCTNDHVTRSSLNGVVDNYKKLKGNTFDKSYSTDKISADSHDKVVYDTSRERDKKISETRTDKICENTKDFSEPTVSTNKISTSSLINKQNNKIFIKYSKADVNPTSVKSNRLEENKVPIIVEQSNKNSTQLTYTPIMQSNNQLYVQVPTSNVIFTEPTSNSNSINISENTGNIMYATASGDIISPQKRNKTAVIDNSYQTMLMNQPIATNAIGSINTNNNEIETLDKQEAKFTKKISNNVSNSGNGSLNKIVCDGDAGRTSPAVTRRLTSHISDITENIGTCEIFGADSTSRENDPSSKNHARVRRNFKRKIRDEHHTMYISSGPGSPSTRKYIFPQVTNNHNACHQPRLIPQYMHLHDLKFRVCGSDGVQMILYDMFSIKIPMESAVQRKRSKSGIAALEEPAIGCLVQNETASNLDSIDGTKTINRLNGTKQINNETKYIADATIIDIMHNHEDAKENLDPVSRTVSCNTILDNINLANSTDNAMANEYIYNEHDDHMRLISSDINLRLLNRTIRSTNVDNNVTNSVGFIPNNRDQTSRTNLEDTQLKQSTCDVSAITEDRIGARLLCNRIVRSVDLDLNIVNMNKNIEKALIDDVTISTNQHIDDRGINSGHTDDSSMICLSNSSVTNNNCRSNDNYKCLNDINVMRLKIQNSNIARHVPSVTSNEHSISNKQIDAYDSRQFFRCTLFHEDIVNGKIESNFKPNVDSSLKISIDLRKIQNLINSKPELFMNVQYVGDRQRKYTNLLSDEDRYMQKEQVKYHDMGKSDTAKLYNLSTNSQSQIYCINDTEEVQV